MSLVEKGVLTRTGKKRGTNYQLKRIQSYSVKPLYGEYQVPHLKFFDDIPKHRRALVLTHIRDLWTHSSIALEGNTLSLGDTHFTLEEGLTVSGKPLREHQEIIGHACLIEQIYTQVKKLESKHNINQEFLFLYIKLYKQKLLLIFINPMVHGKLKLTLCIPKNEEDELVFIEFADSRHVDALMQECITYFNQINIEKLN